METTKKCGRLDKTFVWAMLAAAAAFVVFLAAEAQAVVADYGLTLPASTVLGYFFSSNGALIIAAIVFALLLSLKKTDRKALTKLFLWSVLWTTAYYTIPLVSYFPAVFSADSLSAAISTLSLFLPQIFLLITVSLLLNSIDAQKKAVNVSSIITLVVSIFAAVSMIWSACTAGDTFTVLGQFMTVAGTLVVFFIAMLIWIITLCEENWMLFLGGACPEAMQQTAE